MKNLLYIFLFGSFLSCKAQGTAWDKVEIKVDKLTDNVAMLQGRGGNIGVITSNNETLVIDAQFEPLYDKIKAAIATLTEIPASYLLNTHWHGDHTGGNNKFKEDGALLVAHKNVKERLSTDQKVEYFDNEVPASPKETLPEVTFTDQLSIQIGDEIVNVIHLENAHTDGDAIVHLPVSNVIHMGDTYFAGMYPFIDLSTGGNVTGVINACEKALALSDANTQIIPGHGPLSTSEDLKAYMEMIKDLKSKVATAKKEGLSLKEIVGKNLTAEYDDQYNGGFIKSKDFITFIFNSL